MNCQAARQTQPAEKARPEAGGILQRAAIQPSCVGPQPSEVPLIVHEVLRSPGQRLDAHTRAFMEPRFGQDFSQVPAHANGAAPVPAHLTIGAAQDGFEQEAEMMAQRVLSRSASSISDRYDFGGVRIHTDGQAAESARAVNALAYTVGKDIVFGRGQYNPNTSAGTKLMAHELTHVIQQAGASKTASGPSPNERYRVPHTAPTTGVIARQPDSPKPQWEDFPAKDLNKVDVITVNEQGKFLRGKSDQPGVWRVKLRGLSHGLQEGDKGPAFESPKGLGVALIPNTVNPSAPDKNANVPVDVLLHLHGFGIGSRELRPGEHDLPGVLEAGQLRDVELYQMEQQLLSHVAVSNQFIIAVLPQGFKPKKESLTFGDLGSNSDAYLKEVFDKLIGLKYLPKGAIPGRVIVSAHSGGGPTAMAIAEKRAGTEVILFDAINWNMKTCTSNEIDRVEAWVWDRINADVDDLLDKGITDDQQQANKLKTNGTRFRGITSGDLTSKNECSYGFYYGRLKKFITDAINDGEVTLKKKKVKLKQKLGAGVKNQLQQNFRVDMAKGLEGLTGMERHERVMSGQEDLGQKNLEDALKD